jgi:hypothetical protein
MHQFIKTYYNDLELIKNDVFILIKPYNSSYTLESPYHFIHAYSEELLELKYLKSIETYPLKDIPETYTYLSKNMSKEMFIHFQLTNCNSKIMNQFSILVFSNRKKEEYIIQKLEELRLFD